MGTNGDDPQELSDLWRQITEINQRGASFSCFKEGMGKFKSTVMAQIGQPVELPDGEHLMGSEGCGKSSCNFGVDILFTIESGHISSINFSELGACKLEGMRRKL